MVNSRSETHEQVGERFLKKCAKTHERHASTHRCRMSEETKRERCQAKTGFEWADSKCRKICLTERVNGRCVKPRSASRMVDCSRKGANYSSFYNRSTKRATCYKDCSDYKIRIQGLRCKKHYLDRVRTVANKRVFDEEDLLFVRNLLIIGILKEEDNFERLYIPRNTTKVNYTVNERRAMVLLFKRIFDALGKTEEDLDDLAVHTTLEGASLRPVSRQDRRFHFLSYGEREYVVDGAFDIDYTADYFDD